MAPELGSLPFLVSTPESQRSPSGKWAICQMIRRTRKIRKRKLHVCWTWEPEGHETNQALPSWVLPVGKTEGDPHVHQGIWGLFHLLPSWKQSLTSCLPQMFQGSLVQPEQMEWRLKIEQVKTQWWPGPEASDPVVREICWWEQVQDRVRKALPCWSSGWHSGLPMQGDPGSIPGHRARSHMVQPRVCMPQLKVLHAKTKPWQNQNLKKRIKKKWSLLYRVK